jgi:hypothetical protein
MSNMAARNFEDLLQVCIAILLNHRELMLYKCSIPVFDGLLPNDHNTIVMDLLFVMAHWHGLAKLRMHSDLTLDILDQQTTELGEKFRQFKAKVCTAYHTQELDREVDSRYRREAKEAAKRAEKSQVNANMEGVTRRPRAGVNAKGKEKAHPEQSHDAPIPKQSRKTRSFNFGTYKFHALGDYVASIRQFGTTSGI